MKNEKWRRVSISMPSDMLQNYRIKSDEAGISLSRLLYLRLKLAKSIWIVPRSMQDDLAAIHTLLWQIQAGEYVTQKQWNILRSQVETFEKLVGNNDVQSKGVRVYA
ncbi:hypothetical protein AXF19_04655 [Selenomonas sp. oral taxon 126]|uniref:hypothetical protein n=1 Tax=Selenomonas sp. oral taxon 126 TaxID=712528 RepID=UPI000807871A|nr:hypothetical protein [Selenomonas sp. oral taxon 126]ANR70336.1 hypothetical protein AXF19_04655 [Selenomonas sp. oral taxon 126]